MNLAHSNVPPSTIPELVVVPTTMQLFMFSAVTWNRHRIHYDKEAAQADGHSNVVVQRALIGNFLARLLEHWLHGDGEVHELSWKVLKSAVPDKPLYCQGEVSLSQDNMRHCDLRIVDGDDNVIATGKALCVLKE